MKVTSAVVGFRLSIITLKNIATAAKATKLYDISIKHCVYDDKES